MRIMISGSHGLIGEKIAHLWEKKGHELFYLSRKEPLGNRTIFWDPAQGKLDPKHLEEIDVILNLAGEPIQALRWTEYKKKLIASSRIRGSQTIAQAIDAVDRPIFWMNASAVGYYGSRGEEILDESALSGVGFLAATCSEWENVARSSRRAQLAILRFSLVFDESRGALPTIALPFRCLFGGRIGDGQQWMSWIHIDDLLAALSFILEKRLTCTFNICSPNPCRNHQFTEAMGEVLHRPTLFPLPKRILSLLFGEMGEELLLSSTRALPQKLLEKGFCFAHPTMKEALEDLL